MVALESDVGDVQGGTTKEGIHMGVMSGTLDLVQRGFIGSEYPRRGPLLRSQAPRPAGGTFVRDAVPPDADPSDTRARRAHGGC